MNKRGIVFTTIAVILISILILMFLIQSSKKTELEITKSTVETDTLNSFVKALKTQHIPNAIKVSSNQAIYALLDYMDRHNVYLENTYEDFRDTIFSGYYQGEKLSLMFPIYEEEELNYTINSTLDEIKQLASQTNIQFSYQPFNTNIVQKDSWTLKVTIINFNFTVSSSDGKVKWIDVVNISGEFPITNYRDPLILIEEDNNFTIKQVEDTTNYANWEDDLNKIEQQMWNHTFNDNSDAPSFLMRMMGDLSSSNGYGIEYIVNPTFNDNPAGYSLIDHHYYNNIPEQCTPPLSGYHNFRIEENHLLLYGITVFDIQSWSNSGCILEG